MSNNNAMTSKQKQALHITEAFLFFNSPFTLPFNQNLFQIHLSNLQHIPNHTHIIKRCLIALTERYAQIVKNYENLKMQEYLMKKMINLICKLSIMHDNGTKGQTSNKKQQQQQQFQYLVVLIWTSIQLINKCKPEKQYKQLILEIIILIQICIKKISNLNISYIQNVYPQISTCLMYFILHNQCINHNIFGKCLEIMGELLKQIFTTERIASNNIPNLKNLNMFMNINNGNKQNKIDQSFEEKCILRLQAYFKLLITKLPTLQLIYHQSIAKFVEKIWYLAKKYLKIMCPLAILGQLAGVQPNYSIFNSSQIKLIKSAMTHQFLQLLQSTNTNILDRSQTLKRLQSMVSHIDPTYEQCEQILHKFTTQLYLIHNNHSLIIPHAPITESAHLIEINNQHSFYSYPIPLNSLLESLNYQCQRILIQKMPYVQTSLTNVIILKRIIEKIPAKTTNILLQLLLQSINLEEDQYMVDMSLTKFCQFLTRILIIYWLINKSKQQNRYKIPSAIAFNLFQILSGSQAIRILKAGFEQQEILISMILIICYNCYNAIVADSNEQGKNLNLSPIKKLKLKLSLLQCTINNIYEESFIIKLASYYILLAESAPSSIEQTLKNLTPTLINRNISSIEFITALIKLTILTQSQSQDLANKFMQYRGNEEIMKILLSKISTETARKCILASSSQRGKWINLLLGNTKLLYRRQIKQQGTLEAKSQNFYMNDGQNVQISNALGVILLQLGPRWQYSLQVQSPYRQSALDLLLQLINLDNKLIFFRIRFISILQCILNILQKQSQSKLGQRICYKLYQFLARIPKENYALYLQKIKQDQRKLQIQTESRSTKKQRNKQQQKQQNIVLKLYEAIKRKHKKLYVQYLSNPNDKNFDNSDIIITKLENCLQNDKI